MIHFLTEGGNGNKELKNHRWFIPDGVRHHLEKIKDSNKKDELSKNHTTKEAWDHLVFILDQKKGISYNEMKRMKNWFDKNSNSEDTKQYELYGGNIMKTWIDNQLKSATLIVKQHKEAQRAMGKHNAFIKPHEADRQTTPSKIDTKTPTYNPLTLKKQNRLKELSAIKEHKTIIITEEQKKILDEVVNGKLRSDFFDELETYASIGNFNQCIKLATDYFGHSIGCGSSRFVFQIDDEKILKIASNESGITQNKVETDAYNETIKFKGIFPIVFSSSENYTYIISEYVLPLNILSDSNNGNHHDDYFNCLGVTEKEFKYIIETIEKFTHSNEIDWAGVKSTEMNGNENVFRFIMNHTKENNNFALLMDYLIANPELSRESFNCINMGMTRRNGKPWIVILDNGWDGNTSEMYGHENFGTLNV